MQIYDLVRCDLLINAVYKISLHSIKKILVDLRQLFFYKARHSVLCVSCRIINTIFVKHFCRAKTVLKKPLDTFNLTSVVTLRCMDMSD